MQFFPYMLPHGERNPTRTTFAEEGEPLAPCEHAKKRQQSWRNSGQIALLQENRVDAGCEQQAGADVEQPLPERASHEAHEPMTMFFGK
ncbi:MAG: hypothetical protein SOZ01_01525 [Selenomonadaceae bacterium]|nr:hypothetical protein [Selenomonadaceae bacterium]MDD6119063.1 hypothetical protein [Selenomonadaceae bacterium]MDD7057394.1 hypothetical protein [Selenomonadaceae bacterium]MDY3915413.1 hypothetical protein [Selenomonadaceae bacterium]